MHQHQRTSSLYARNFICLVALAPSDDSVQCAAPYYSLSIRDASALIRGKLIGRNRYQAGRIWPKVLFSILNGLTEKFAMHCTFARDADAAANKVSARAMITQFGLPFPF